MGETTWTPGLVTLEWTEGHYLHGLRIVMRRRPVGDVLKIWRESDPSTEDGRKASELDYRQRATVAEDSVTSLAGLIEEWSAVTRTGEPIPATPDGLLSMLTFEDIDDIWTEYHNRTTRVARPLSPSSDDGSPSAGPEFDLPTVPLPTSQPD